MDLQDDPRGYVLYLPLSGFCSERLTIHRYIPQVGASGARADQFLPPKGRFAPKNYSIK
jgi:hypothetical protein